MKGYVERVDINDDKSARFVVFVPKLSKKQFVVLRGVFESRALIAISLRPIKRAADARPCMHEPGKWVTPGRFECKHCREIVRR